MTDHTDQPIHVAQVSADHDDDGNITRITIDISPYAPTGPGSVLADLVNSNALERWISGAACGTQLPRHRTTLAEIMWSTGAVGGQTHEQQRLAALVARDRDGWSWRRIATCMAIHHSTAERQVKSARWDMAEHGIWVDARGVHDGGPADEASGHLSKDEWVTFAMVLAHYRERYEWSETVEVTPPEALKTDRTTYATVTPRADGADPYRLWITRPVSLVGGPYDGSTHQATPGDRGWFPVVDPEDSAAGRHAYQPTAPDSDTWTYRGVEPGVGR